MRNGFYEKVVEKSDEVENAKLAIVNAGFAIFQVIANVWDGTLSIYYMDRH